MIFFLFLLTKAAHPWRTFHRIAQPVMSYEDEAKFLLISKTFRKFSERILVNDDITIFKFEDKLKFPFKIALHPKMEQFLQEKISQNSERLKDVEFAVDVHPSGWRQLKLVAMLDRETNELSSCSAEGTRSSFIEMFPCLNKTYIEDFLYSGLSWDLVTSDNIFRMLLKNNFPLGIFSATALDTDTLMFWACEFSLPKTALYLKQKRFPKELKNQIDFSQLFSRLIFEAKEAHEADGGLGRRFMRVFRIILRGLAKTADFHEFFPGDRRLTYLSRYFPESFEILIKRGLNVAKTGDSLHIAAEYGNVDLIETLLTYGMDVDARGDAYFTALMRAARNMNAESMKVLLSHGADTREALDILEDAHERNYQHARHENFDLCQNLLRYPRIFIEISRKKSVSDKFKFLRDKFTSFCHVVIGV